jgi:putative intracellular protease/amidase
MKRVLVPLAEGFDELDAAVVVDGRAITSRGLGTALELVAQLAGPRERQKIEGQLQRSGARQ